MNKLNSLVEMQSLMLKVIQQKVSWIELSQIVVDKPSLNTQQRLKIYQEAYKVRLTESICDDFLRLKESIKENEFQKLVSDFIDQRPSRYKNLGEYSQEFVQFISINKNEYLKLAYLDWYEILSSRACEPQTSLTANEMNESVQFFVQIKPSTFLIAEKNFKLVVYRQFENIHYFDLDQTTLMFLTFLEKPKSIDEIAIYTENEKLSSDFITSLLQDFMAKQIIYTRSI